MCFLALLYNVVPDYPVVAAANRDEYLGRGGTLPREIRDGVWAGQDPVAGGTWLGVNSAGRIVGIANVGQSGGNDPDARSRGLLCLDLLTIRECTLSPDVLAEQTHRHAYNGFNLLVADASAAWVATYADRRLDVRVLTPGIHIIANTRPDEPNDPKVARGRQLLVPTGDIDQVQRLLATVCADHGVRDDGADAICVHGELHGTLSSTIIAIHRTDASWNRYMHAEGNPCTARYRDVSALLR